MSPDTPHSLPPDSVSDSASVDPAVPTHPVSLDACIRATLATYFADLGASEPHALYDMVVKAVERPLLDVVMQRAEGNQSRAAEWLGINRNTLRRKLLEHQLVK
jgi:Fis family transcriptional regulator